MKTNTRLLLFGVITLTMFMIGLAHAETVVWTKDFDEGNNDNDWVSDTGQLWLMVSPTGGPATNSLGYHAHSGCCCATTGLTGNYLPNQNARLYSLFNFVVPAANQNPRLRFWQWYSISWYDNAYVEIRPVGSNTWTTISPNYAGTGVVKGGGGVWTRPSLDLGAYAGQTVQIAFHFTSDNAGTVDVGWFVDEVALVTGTPVFNNPETFETESAMTDWAVDGGTWQIGSPKVGPPTNAVGGHAYSGTNCAATCFTGTYQANVDSRLINLATFVVPAANQNPRLRFWQWYSISWYDNAYVEIRPVGSNTWTTISPNYAGTGVVKGGGGTWTRPSLDLSAYAGQTVQIAFHFTSDNASTVDVGWFVDDVALVTGTPVFNNPETFEGGLGDWAVDGGTWQVGSPKVGPGGAYSGTNCATTCLTGNYQANVDSRLISAPFIVPPLSSSPALRFRNWYSFSTSDYGIVEIKPVGSVTWTGLVTNSGVNSLWAYPFIDLSAYANQNVQIAFHFTSDNAGTVSVGWFIDDITILGFIQPPLITQPPTNQTVAIETPVTFVVGASGAGTLYYQWQFNDVPIQGATNTSYFIPSAQPSNAGNYSVIVSNSAGATFSPEALLTVRPLPGQLTNIVVNPVSPIGTVNYTNGVFTITGSGEDIQGTADAFEYVCESLIGDGQIVARVTSLVGADPAAEAGVMIRESFYAGSTHTFLRVNANTNVVFRRRLTTDAYSIDTTFAPTNHSWLRLARMGNILVAHCSTNGVNWEYVWFTSINMSNQVQVGLAVTAHHDGQFATATFDNVTIGALSPFSGTWPLPRPKFLRGGEAWGNSEFQRVGGYEFLLAGAVGEYDTIKSTTNLSLPFASWQPLVTVTNTYGVVPILDPGALTNKMKFYRAQKIGP